MWDPGAAGVTAFAVQSPLAPAVLFVAGACTSIGPCSVPRMLAISGIATTGSMRAARCVSFVAGMILAYGAFAVVGGMIAATLRYSAWIYVGVALAMLTAGIYTITRRKSHAGCSRAHAAPNAGSAMIMGLTTALVISPCCTPVITALVGYVSTTRDPFFAALCLAAFGVGHAAPVFAIATAGRYGSKFANSTSIQGAVPTVSGALMIALAAYYLVLA